MGHGNSLVSVNSLIYERQPPKRRFFWLGLIIGAPFSSWAKACRRQPALGRQPRVFISRGKVLWSIAMCETRRLLPIAGYCLLVLYSSALFSLCETRRHTTFILDYCVKKDAGIRFGAFGSLEFTGLVNPWFLWPHSPWLLWSSCRCSAHTRCFP